jgi:hypothetical protein
MARHKSNVDFGGGNLYDRRAIGSAHHFGRDIEGRGSLLPVLHIQAQVQIGWNHAAEQSRAAAYAYVRRGGDISRHFQLGWHGGEFQWHLKTDLGVWLGGVRSPQEERNGQRQKLQARIGENVLAQEAHRLSPHWSSRLRNRGRQDHGCPAARDHFAQTIA